MVSLKGSLAAVAAVTLSASVAFADATLIRSRVIVTPGEMGTGQTYRVVGPDSTEYVLDAAPTEVTKMVKVIETNPNTVVEFHGSTVQEGGVNKFHVTDWQKSTTTTTNDDGMGTVTKSRTVETTTRDE